VPKDAASAALSPTFAALFEKVQTDSFDSKDFGTDEPPGRPRRNQRMPQGRGAVDAAATSRFIARQGCECTPMKDV
jgi:hypothetical protein